MRGRPYERFTVGADGIDLGLSFKAWAATIENPTSRYLYIPSSALFVPPYTYSRTVQIPGTRRGRLIWEAPPGIAQPAPVAGEVAYVVFWDRRPSLVISPVTSAPGGGGSTVTANQGTPAAAANRWPVELYTGLAAYDARQIRALTSADVVDVSDRAGRALGVVASITANVNTDVIDRAARLLGVVYGSQGAQLLQRAATFDAQVQLRTAGAEYDARQIRALTSADVVTAAQGTPAAAANRWPVELYSGLTAYDARDVSDRAARLLGVVYGSQGAQLLQRAATFDAQVQLRTAGAEYDARQIRALTTADAVNVGQWIGSAAPTVGAKTMANSLPVVIASDQATYPVTATLAAASDSSKAEDAGHVSGDRGAFMLGVRNDALADLTSADLDYSPLATDIKGRQIIRDANVLIATTISGANAAVTLTIAAAGAGLFHYITSVEIVNVNPTAAAIVGSAVTLAYTTTNIPGAPAWTEGNALAAGVSKVVERLAFPGGIKTTTANTATTIVAPAIGAGGVCRITATYYIAP